MRYDFDSYNSLLLVDRNLNKDLFLKRVGAVSGYAVKLFSDIYDAMFSESIDLERVYYEYYKDEFSSFGDYLKEEFSLPDSIHNNIMKDLKENEHLKVILWEQLSYGFNDIESFIFGEKMRETFEKVLTGRES